MEKLRIVTPSLPAVNSAVSQKYRHANASKGDRFRKGREEYIDRTG